MAIGARPGVGKSYLAQKIMSNVMNVNINPQADDYVWLRCEFEMNPEDLMLRSLSKKMGKDIQDILLNEMSDEEIKEMQKCLKEENSSRITYIPKPSTVDELQNFLWNEYMPINKDKKNGIRVYRSYGPDTRFRRCQKEYRLVDNHVQYS